MIIKLLYNILDIDSFSFESDIQLSSNEYETMLMNKIAENNAILKNFNDDDSDNDYLHFNPYVKSQKKGVEEKYIQIPCEAYISLINGSDVTINDIEELSRNGKMTMLNININPNNLDYDVYSDLKQWIGESMNIKNNINVSEKDKISMLPTRNFSIDINDSIFNLKNIKIIKDNGDKNFPFNFIALIDKITI